MRRFTRENTDGYSDSDLATLNAMFTGRMQRYYPHVREQKSTADYVAERVQAEFDVQRQ